MSNAPKKLPSLRYLRECLDYRPRTGELVWLMRPQSHFKSERVWKRFNTMYAGTVAGNTDKSNERVLVSIDGVLYFAHRIAWKLHYGKEPPDLIDHKDTNGLNNRIKNLREASKSENSYNRGAQANNTSGVKGVTFHVDGRVKMEYSIPKADVHYFAPDEMAETREIRQRWEVDIMPVVVGTICPLDELRNAVLEDQWKAQANG